MNDPPDHTAEFSAANLLSLAGFLLDLVVDDLALVLRAHTAEILLLRLRDAELVPRTSDVLGELVPVGGLLLGRADEVVDVLEVDVAQVGAPPRHRTHLEVAQALQAVLPHPVGLVLERGDLLDDPLVQAALGLEDGVGGIFPVESVALGELFEVLFLGDCHEWRLLGRSSRRITA